MPRTQINFRLPDNLIAALKQRAEFEKTNVTDLVINLLEQSLGLTPDSSSIDSDQLDSQIAKRIAKKIQPLENRIATLELALGKYTA